DAKQKIVEEQKQTIKDLTDTKQKELDAKQKIVEEQKQTIKDLTDTKQKELDDLTEIEETNIKQKKYLYNKINKIPEKKIIFYNKFVNLIKQYLKNLGLINNQTWKLLFRQYSQIYFIIILCAINILFYSLLIKRFKSY
ncbi:hypothetical protein OC686_01990, partial ['Opuntia sp.' phytoplasma]|uniref:hypothetical protein n=2 Tax=Candidatus Phytoplasma asiaticum TaxID=2763338 RepID=UPI002712D725